MRNRIPHGLHHKTKKYIYCKDELLGVKIHIPDPDKLSGLKLVSDVV
jgi:hypothetical protein